MPEPMGAALASFRNPGDIQRVQKNGGVTYKRVMLLSPGIWADAGSGQHVDYSADGIRASADNFVDIDTVLAANPDWGELSNVERVERLRELGEEALVDELPINFLHGEALYGAESLEAVGHVPVESAIIDDNGRLYGDLVLHGDTPQSETAIELMDEVLEATRDQGKDAPPVGPSVEIPADDVVIGEHGVATLEEAWYSGVAIVFNPASRPVELGVQAAERAVAMTAAGTAEGSGTIYRANETDVEYGDTFMAALRQRWRMATTDSDPELPDFDELSDEDLARSLETMRSDMDELTAALQGDDEFSAVSQAVDEYLAADGEPDDGADEFLAWATQNTDIDDAVLNGVLEAYLEEIGADDLSETPVDALMSWLGEQTAAAGDGDGDENPEEEPGGSELTVDDLEAVKQVVGEVSEHLGDIKDLLTAREDERETSLDDLERRLSDIEDEPVIKSLTDGDTEPFIGDADSGRASEVEYEDVFL